MKSIELIASASEHSQPFADQDGATEAITIDLMRRAGMFQDALSLVEEVRKRKVEDIFKQIVNFQEYMTHWKSKEKMVLF